MIRCGFTESPFAQITGEGFSAMIQQSDGPSACSPPHRHHFPRPAKSSSSQSGKISTPKFIVSSGMLYRLQAESLESNTPPEGASCVRRCAQRCGSQYRTQCL